MTEQLDPKPTDRILEIGTGSGYQAAILSRLVAEVYTIEIIEPLARRAEANLKRLGYSNVKVLAGDGYKGWPEHAPFDGIIVTCAPDHIPQPLADQLRDGGRMIIPVGPPMAPPSPRRMADTSKHLRLPMWLLPRCGLAVSRYPTGASIQATSPI